MTPCLARVLKLSIDIAEGSLRRNVASKIF